MDLPKLLKQQLQASIIAFGSEGVDLPTFTNYFKEDWCEDLHKHAKQLGFGEGPDSVLAMLKTFPMTVQEEYGQIKLKTIPCEGTKKNLALIDKSNEEKAERKRQRQRNPANYHDEDID